MNPWINLIKDVRVPLPERSDIIPLRSNVLCNNIVLLLSQIGSVQCEENNETKGGKMRGRR